MKQNELMSQSFVFAKHIILTVRDMEKRRIELALRDQLLRCGTSIGANITEAQHAQSTRDFVSKLEIAQKESFECLYWLRLLADLGDISAPTADRLISECASLRNMLSAAILTVKSNPNPSDHL